MNEDRAGDVERAHHAGRAWRDRLRPEHQAALPQWWEWAVAAAPYHLVDCDWVTIGVSTDHCTCGLTRIIAKLLEIQHG